VTAEPSSRVDLALREIPAAAVARSLWSRLPAWRPSDLHLKVETAAEILDKDRQHLDFLHRHGLARVLAFYAEELMPAAGRLPAGNERWQLWFKLGCRVVAMQAAAGADLELTEQAERLQADLPHARFADDAQADREARQQVRAFLAGQLAGAAERLLRAGHQAQALRAYAALDRLGAASPAQRMAHARLRWRLNDRSPEALRVYLRARDGNGNGKVQEPLPAQIDRFLEESLAVAEELPRHELEERLFLNQLALCSSRPPHPAWRNAGLAYLRLGQPSRALPYLERAHGLNGSDGGAGAFYLGQARFQVADYPGSTAAFEEAIARDYSKVRIAAWLGLAYARLREWEKALAIFRQAEAETAEVEASELYLNWGRASFILGEVEDARLRFEKAAAAGTADPRAGYGVALCRESLGERAAALAELHRVLGRCPDFAPAVHRLGLLLEDQGDFAGALPRFHAAVALSPRDPEYRLSLGLALGRTGDGEALVHLAAAAEGGAGGPEVLRRLFLFYQRQGDAQQARRWLAALAAVELSPAVAALRARDLASQATEAFNAGRYQGAAAQWEQVAADRPEEATVAERFVLALVHATAERLRKGESAGVGEAAERAFQLAPALPDCCWLYAASRLLDGDAATAARLLQGLAPEQLARPELASLWAMAAALAGEDTAEAQEEPRRPFLELLRMLAAAAGGRFEEAAQHCEAPGSWRELGLPPGSLNALVAEVKLRGTRRKRQQVVRFLEELEARDGAGSWAFGVALARQILATRQGLARAGEADPAELAACQETYRRLLGAMPSEAAAAAASTPLHERYTRLLLFLACHHAQRGRLTAALDVLQELASLPLPVPAKVRDLERILRQRLAQPSQEKAYALLEEDPDSARQIWETLLAKNPGDLLARHHLACLAWSRAYDTILARHLDDSLPFWSEGLEHFRLLYGSEAYWQTLREKGRALGTAAAHPFDEAAFEAWCGEALYQRAATLLHLIFHTLAGGDLAEAKEADVFRAKDVMKLLRISNLDAALRQQLADDLADHYLDPDPTRVPDFARSRRRATAVVDIDPENLKARTFLLRSVTYEVSTRSEEGDRDFAAMAKLLKAEERHAEWLEEHRRDLPPEPQGRATSDLAAFYDQFGAVWHQEGQAATERFNNLKPGSSREARRLLEAIQKSYRDSDRWYEKSLALDPVNLRAKDRLDHHRNQYLELTKAIRQIPQSS
jgi:Flp pilus assembly protein TadD